MGLYSKFKRATGSQLVEPINIFFTEHNVNGYTSKDGLVDHVNALTKQQFEHLEEAFEYVRLGFKIVNKLEPKDDPKTGQTVLWSIFEMPNGKRRLPLFYEEWIARFLTKHQQSGIDFEVDFELLLAEAGVKFNETTA